MTDRIYKKKKSDVHQLAHELTRAGISAPGRFFGVSTLGDDTLVHVADDLTRAEARKIDKIVKTHRRRRQR